LDAIEIAIIFSIAQFLLLGLNYLFVKIIEEIRAIVHQQQVRLIDIYYWNIAGSVMHFLLMYRGIKESSAAIALILVSVGNICIFIFYYRMKKELDRSLGSHGN
jgi:hypothetical protein